MNFSASEPSSFGVEEAEKNEARFLKAIEAVGGKPVAYYTLLGRYDALTILEVPDAKSIASLMSAMKMAEPNVNTKPKRQNLPHRVRLPPPPSVLTEPWLAKF